MNRIGFAKREITPPVGTELGGYAGYRPCTGVHDPLYCRAVVLEQSGTLYALAALDLLCADESLCRRIAERAAGLGISRERLVVSAIHSHSAPVGVIPGEGPLAGINRAILPQAPAFADYMAAVIDAAAEALAEAAGRLEPFRVRSSRGPLPPIGSERHTGAPACGSLTVVQCRTDSGRDLLLYHFPCHPTVMSPANLLVSADLAGGIEALLDADIAVFLNGAAGDISTRFTRRESSFAECARMGAMAAEAIRSLVEGQPFSDPAPLHGFSADLTLEARRVEPEESARRQLEEATARWKQAETDGADAGALRILKSYVEGAGVNLEFSQTMGNLRQLTLPVRVFRFAGIHFVTVPGELYSTLLPREAAPVCYANGYYRYIADQGAYDAGHYEALAAILARGQGEILKEKIQQLLDQLQQQEVTL
nr:hypothetical protein [Oscillospiraceae bacterium]